MHLVVDGYGADPGRLGDAGLVRGFLDGHPGTLGMTKMVPPQVYTYRGETPEDWGVSGFVLIAESHISVHTFPGRGYVNVDVFSCKEFDAEASRGEVEATFGLDDVRVWILERGTDYSTPREARERMARDRARLASVGSADG